MTAEDLKRLPPLSLPLAQIRLQRDEKGNLKVFDILRKKWVTLTPEEFVRQNFTHWLMDSLKYPAGLLQNEVSVNVNDTHKRCDTLAFDREGKPLLVVEYKAPNIEITQDVFEQIYRYNLSLKAKYLVVSNGRKHYCCRMDYQRESYHFIPVVPSFLEAIGLPMEN